MIVRRSFKPCWRIFADWLQSKVENPWNGTSYKDDNADIHLDSSLPRRVLSSGGSREGIAPPRPAQPPTTAYFLHQTEARKQKKIGGGP